MHVTEATVPDDQQCQPIAIALRYAIGNQLPFMPYYVDSDVIFPQLSVRTDYKTGDLWMGFGRLLCGKSNQQLLPAVIYLLKMK